MCKSQTEKNNVESRLSEIVIPMYANPPVYGARVVTEVLRDEELRKLWHQELEVISKRYD